MLQIARMCDSVVTKLVTMQRCRPPIRATTRERLSRHEERAPQIMRVEEWERGRKLAVEPVIEREAQCSLLAVWPPELVCCGDGRSEQANK